MIGFEWIAVTSLLIAVFQMFKSHMTVMYENEVSESCESVKRRKCQETQQKLKNGHFGCEFPPLFNMAVIRTYTDKPCEWRCQNSVVKQRIWTGCYIAP